MTGDRLPARVGPYFVVRERARAPGSTLVEAKDADGERRLLQLARFRAPADDAERGERLQIERQLAQRTAELVTGADVVLHAHGGADASRGERFLFWALPYSDTPTLPERAHEGRLSVTSLLKAGIDLAHRLIGRHQRNVGDPRLSEQFVHLDDAGELFLSGVPIGIDGRWLAGDLDRLCLAPEEEASRVATPGGDVWRLGQLLLRMSQRIGAPASVEAGLLSLTHADPAARLSTITLAEERLRQLRGAFYESEETTQTGPSAWDAATEDAMAPRISAIPHPLNGASGHSASSNGASGNGVTKNGAHAAAPIEPRIWPDDASSSQLSFGALIDFDSARVRALESLSDPAGPRAADPDAETRQSSPMTPLSGPQPSATLRIEVREATVKEEARSLVAIPELLTDPEAALPKSPDQAAIEALAASWSQTVLPPGESPWSEVVTPRGTHRRAQDSFHGVQGDLQIPTDLKSAIAVVKREETVWDEPPPPAPPYRPVDSGEIEAEIAAAISGFDTKKVVAGVLAVLVIFGLFALIARSGDDIAPQDDLLVAPAANEFLLESDPPAATVVAEADGRILGKTPIHFLVPSGAKSRVFLVLSGHEPLRLDLPERGGIKARLSKVEQPGCQVTLTAVDGTPFEGVGVPLSAGAKVDVPGAAVVRAQEGSGMEGARMILCPSLGGEPSVRLKFDRRGNVRRLRISEPVGSVAYVNGEPVGRVPALARATSAFSAIRVDDASGMSEERFVPSVIDVEVRMPAPKPRKIPTLTVPEDRDLFGEDEPERNLLEGRKIKSEDKAAAQAALHVAESQLEAGKLPQATSAYRTCLEADPSKADCHLGLGNLYQRDRRPRKARAHFLRFLELAPNAPDAARVRKLIGS